MKKDGWDWPWFYYAGRVILKLSDKEFWNTTPRKLNVLLKVHMDIEKQKNGSDEEGIGGGSEVAYIDEVLPL